MAYTKAGVRFSDDSYVMVDAENPPAPITGGFVVDVRKFPKQMRAEETYQIDVTVPDGWEVRFSSSGPNSKISVSETGLMTCIGSTTGLCGIEIHGTVDGVDIVNVRERVEVL